MAGKSIVTRKIYLDGREVEYTLERKNVKNVNLRVRPDQSIYISANRGVSEKYIENFLIEKRHFILDAIDRYKRLSEALPTQGYGDGDEILVFGVKFMIRGVSGGRNSAEIRGDELVLTLRKEGADERKKVIDDFMRESCRRAVTTVCIKEYEKFKGFGVAYPEIKFRQMKSRWGSCQPRQGILTFNYELAAVPLECVRYVVLHEFTHFLHPNHSSAFHRRLASFMPEAEVRRRQLEAYGVRLKIEK